jgi:hypothetical protein
MDPIRPESATRELGLFFKPEELLDWKPARAGVGI